MIILRSLETSMTISVNVPFEFCERCPRLDVEMSSAVFDYRGVVSRECVCANENFCRRIVEEVLDAERDKDN